MKKEYHSNKTQRGKYYYSEETFAKEGIREKETLQKKGITGENTTGERNTTTEKPLAETGFHHRKTRMTENLLQKNTAYGRGHEENTWEKILLRQNFPVGRVPL